MAVIPQTSTTLLRDLAQDVRQSRWDEFIVRYRPMMEAFLRARFPSLDADDLIQETFVALCRILPSYRYEPNEEGHFHNYLTGILRNKARQALRKARRQERLSLEMAELHAPANGTDAERDESEASAWRASLFEVALRQFRADESVADRTKRIFERTAINGESPEAVAAAFKMSRHAVDQAKSRALARLRELVKKLETLADE